MAPENPKMTTMHVSQAVFHGTQSLREIGLFVQIDLEKKVYHTLLLHHSVFWNIKASEKSFKKEVQKSDSLQRRYN